MGKLLRKNSNGEFRGKNGEKEKKEGREKVGKDKTLMTAKKIRKKTGKNFSNFQGCERFFWMAIIYTPVDRFIYK